ncbi:hypothetical protein [Paludisphaera borealis]|uniref:Uncharacterized protein n=1 Tax=Paludisphaera borealis TaxID=1387353 RepID=A0A1U7CTG3_9BACT|nr:hypothetical protein [Paludisphaera borealis]APW62189.1 hypothetical protein BSF38_03721 [Paludisphaera borealis]
MTTDTMNPGDNPDHASAAAGLAFAAAVQAWGPPGEAPGRAVGEPGAADEWLRRMHRDEATVDFDWIHPTWLLRALQDESPAVRAVVAAHGPSVVRRALLASGGVPTPDRAPHPEVLDWISALWTERLVGGAAERADDPPAIVALARPSPLEGYRLWWTVGLVKSLLARGPDDAAAERAGWVFDRLGPPPPETRDWARRDLETVAKARVSGRRRTALLGLVTLARLLADCEPFRVRWALQHLPYPIVKRVRTLMPSAPKRAAAVSRLESLILRTAWDHLILENRIATPFPLAPERIDDEH